MKKVLILVLLLFSGFLIKAENDPGVLEELKKVENFPYTPEQLDSLQDSVDHKKSTYSLESGHYIIQLPKKKSRRDRYLKKFKDNKTVPIRIGVTFYEKKQSGKGRKSKKYRGKARIILVNEKGEIVIDTVQMMKKLCPG